MPAEYVSFEPYSIVLFLNKLNYVLLFRLQMRLFFLEPIEFTVVVGDFLSQIVGVSDTWVGVLSPNIKYSR